MKEEHREVWCDFWPDGTLRRALSSWESVVAAWPNPESRPPFQRLTNALTPSVDREPTSGGDATLRMKQRFFDTLNAMKDGTDEEYEHDMVLLWREVENHFRALQSTPPEPGREQEIRDALERAASEKSDTFRPARFDCELMHQRLDSRESKYRHEMLVAIESYVLDETEKVASREQELRKAQEELIECAESTMAGKPWRGDPHNVHLRASVDMVRAHLNQTPKEREDG